MSTEPLESILNRELSIAHSKEVVNVAIPALHEVVNYGTNALMRCATSVQKPVNEEMAVLALYRHILEMTDGVEVLLANACAIPSIPLLRSSFEALLSLEYILENDAEYSRRSLSWGVNYFRRRLKSHEALNPSTEEGKRFAESLRNDQIGAYLALPPEDQVQKGIESIRSLLKDPKLEAIESEFRSEKRKRNRHVEWYSLFNGPENLRKLAQHLRRPAQYDWLYRHWSSTSHALDLGAFMVPSSHGEFFIGRLRDPEPIPRLAIFAVRFAGDATRITLGKFRHSEDISAWYNSNVKEPLLKIAPRK